MFHVAATHKVSCSFFGWYEWQGCKEMVHFPPPSSLTFSLKCLFSKRQCIYIWEKSNGKYSVTISPGAEHAHKLFLKYPFHFLILVIDFSSGYKLMFSIRVGYNEFYRLILKMQFSINWNYLQKYTNKLKKMEGKIEKINMVHFNICRWNVHLWN